MRRGSRSVATFTLAEVRFMKRNQGVGRFALPLVMSFALFAPVRLTASAQTTTGTVRGTVTGTGGAALSGVQIAARNVESGVPRAATSRDDGTYVLPGLTPGAYDFTVRRIGYSPVTRRVVVQIGATQFQDFNLSPQAVTLGTVAVTAAATPEMRTSEVATNVTTEQIENLPTSSRNFLDLAALAPGVTVTEDRINGVAQFKTITAGGQPPQSVNLFIDGTSLKNDLTNSGISGQDASRGNPFPRNAVQEYRVIAQNFKAEYQNSSSAVITATTKSGSNRWHGNAFFGYQNKDLVARDTFAFKADKPDYSRYLAGLSAGGP